MYRFFAEQSACKGEYISIGGADWNHMRNVLRLKTGEQVTVSDGSEREYICEIAEYLEDEARLRVRIFWTAQRSFRQRLRCIRASRREIN